MMSNMESQRNIEVMNFAKQELEAQARKIQEKMGGSDSSSVFTVQVVLRSAIGKNTEQKIASLESEVENLKKTLEDCENALKMANNETDKANKVARDAKNKADSALSQLKQTTTKYESTVVQLTQTTTKYESTLLQLTQTTTKYEKELESVHTVLHQKEMMVEDLGRQLVDKAAMERKEAQIRDLSAKADQFKSRAILSEQKVSELDSRTRELETRAAGAESKLASLSKINEELKKTVLTEKKKTAAFESEVASLKKKLQDTIAGDARVAAEHISDLEKVIAQTKEQYEKEISSLVTKYESSEKRLVAELETIKSKVAAGEKVAFELKDVSVAKTNLEASLSKTKEELSKTVDSNAEALSKEKKKTADLESEVASLRRKLKDIIAGDARVSAEHISDLEKVIVQTKKQYEKEISSLVTKYESSEKRLVTELETTKSKVAAGEKTASELKDVSVAKTNLEASLSKTKEELSKTVDSNAEALSKEKKKTAAFESEVASLKRKLQDTIAGDARVAAEHISDLEKVIAQTKKQYEKEISSLVTKYEASEKRLVTELETTKSKVAAGEKVASELKDVIVAKTNFEASLSKIKEELSKTVSKCDSNAEALSKEKKKTAAFESEVANLRRKLRETIAGDARASAEHIADLEKVIAQTKEHYEKEISSLVSKYEASEKRSVNELETTKSKVAAGEKAASELKDVSVAKMLLEESLSETNEKLSKAVSKCDSNSEALSKEKKKTVAFESEVANLRRKLRETIAGDARVSAEHIADLEKVISQTKKQYEKEISRLVTKYEASEKRLVAELETTKSKVAAGEKVASDLKDVSVAKTNLEASLSKIKEELSKTVSKCDSNAEALSKEKKKTAASESEVANLRRKLRDTIAGDARVSAEHIADLEKVIAQNKEQHEKEISSLVTKYESSEKRLVTELETTKSEVAAGEKTASELKDISVAKTNLEESLSKIKEELSKTVSKCDSNAEALSKEKKKTAAFESEVANLRRKLRETIAGDARVSAEHVADLEKVIAQTKEQYEKEISSLVSKYEASEKRSVTELETTKSKVAAGEKAVSELKNVIVAKTNLEASLSKIKEELSKTVSKCDSNAEALSKEKKKTAAFESEVANLRRKLRETIAGDARVSAEHIADLEKVIAQNKEQHEKETSSLVTKYEASEKRLVTELETTKSKVAAGEKAASELKDVSVAKTNLEASLSKTKEELTKIVSKYDYIAESLSNEKQKTAAFESEVANMRKKLRDAIAGDARVSAEHIADLEKVIAQTKEQYEKEISSLVSKYEASEKRSVTESETTKSKVAELTEMKTKLAEKEHDLKISGDRQAYLGTQLKNLRLERDEAVTKADGAVSKYDYVAEALWNEKKKSAAFESEVANLKKKLRDAFAGRVPSVSTEHIADLEKVIVQTKEQYKKEMSSLVSKYEASEKRLVSELETTKSKVTELTEMKAKLAEKEQDLKVYGDRLADLGTQLKNLRLERDEAVTKVAGAVSKYDYIAEALSNEKKKSAAFESEVANMRKKLRDAFAGRVPSVSTEHIADLEKVIVQTKEQHEKEISSAVSKYEASETWLVNIQLETNSKIAAGEAAASELTEMKAKLAEKEHNLKVYGDRLADLGTQLKNLRLERDEAVTKFDGAVSKYDYIAEALSNEKKKTVAVESEVANLRKKLRDAFAGRVPNVSTEHIADLEKVIVQTKEQHEKEISSVVSKYEASETRLVNTQLETKSKIAAGEAAASELTEMKTKLAEKEHNLKVYGDRLADLGTQLKNLRLERDEAVTKVDGAVSKYDYIAEALSNEKKKTVAIESEVANLRKKLRDAFAGRVPSASTEHIADLEKVIVQNKEQYEKELSSLVSKSEASEKRLVTELETTKSKVAELTEMKTKLAEKEHDLKIYGDRQADLSTQLKNLRLERDEAVTKADGAVSKYDHIAEALSNEKQKTVAIESEVANLKKKLRDAFAGRVPSVSTQHIADLEKVIVVTKEQHEKEMSSLVSKYEASEKRLVTQLETIKSKVAAGEKAASELRLERDEVVQKAESKVKTLEATITKHEVEIQTMKTRSASLEYKLKTVSTKIKERTSVRRSHEEAHRKAEMARHLLEEIEQRELELEKEDMELARSMETSVEISSMETYTETSSVETSQSSKSMSSSVANS